MKQLFTLKSLLCTFANRHFESRKFLFALIIMAELDTGITIAQTNSVIFTGAGIYDWNTLPWSLGHIPLASEDVSISFNLATNGAASVIINATAINVNSITIGGNWGGTGKKAIGIVSNAASTTTIVNDLVLHANGGAASASNPSEVYFVSDGIVSVGGNVSIGVTGSNKASIGSNVSSAVYTFHGDVILGMSAATYPSGKYIFDGTGTQLFSRNNTTYRARLQSVQIGNANAPSVNITGSSTDGINGGDLIVDAGASLVLPAGTVFNQDISGTGSFTSAGLIMISGSAGGFAGSNFPKSFSGYLFNSLSTTEFNGLADQSVPNIDYGNFTITNSSTKTLSGSLKIFGDLLINPGAILDVSTNNYTLNPKANWTNNGIFIPRNGTVSFNNTAAGNISVFSGNTTFYDLVLTNDNGITDFGSTIQTITHSFSTSGGIMNGANSTFIFSGNTSIIGSNSKNFFNLVIDAASTVDHLTGGGNIHVANSFINNGNFTDKSNYTFYFDKSGAVETMSGNGITNFGRLTIGDAGFSFATVLNCTADFTITGGNISLYNSSIFNGYNTVICSTSPCTVNGAGTADFYNVTTNVPLNFGSGTTLSNIGNNLLINPGGSVLVNAPFYNSSATLIYNTTDILFNTGPEWTGNTGVTGKGSPYNIIISNTNHVMLSGSRAIPGALNIGALNSVHINGFVLTANGTITGGGTLTGSPESGLILSNNGNTGVLYFNPNISPGDSSNYLKTFIINADASVALGNALNIAAGSYSGGYGTVKVDGLLNSAGYLTLKSESRGTARIIESSGRVIGNVIMERFIPPIRAWRFLAVPFEISAQTIHDAWQEGAIPNPDIYTHNDPKPGYGTQITYNNNTADGFDVNTTLNPSLKIWDQNSQAWSATAPSTMFTNIKAHNAYCLFVRGSRGVDLSQGTAAIADATVLRITGVLNENGGSVMTTLTGNNGDYVFIGNPFTAPVNLINVLNHPNSNGVLRSQFKVWDPKLAGNKNVGAYVTYNNGVWAPLGGSYTNGSLLPIIQSGQAFMVQISGSNPKLEFQQSDKYTGEQLEVFGLEETKQPAFPVIYTNLLVSSSGSWVIADGVATAFSRQFSALVDSNDASKMWNFDENLALVRDEKALAIEFRPIPKVTDTVFYRLYLRQQPYVLKIFAENLPGKLPVNAWIVDRYLHTRTKIDLYDTTLYEFMPNSDTNSYRNRFILIINRNKEKSFENFSIIANKPADSSYVYMYLYRSHTGKRYRKLIKPDIFDQCNGKSAGRN